MCELHFYSNDVCPFAYRVRLALAEKAIDHAMHTLDLLAIPDWYHAISPTGKLPLLKRGDEIIWESTVINEFLEEAYPKRPLLPKALVARAHARIWIEYCNTAFQPNYCGLVFELDKGKHAAIRRLLHESLKTVDEELAKTDPGPYWLGEHISLVDLTYYPFFEHAPVLSHYRGFDISDDYKYIHRWLAAMRERPSVLKNRREADFYIQAYKPFVDGTIDH